MANQLVNIFGSLEIFWTVHSFPDITQLSDNPEIADNIGSFVHTCTFHSTSEWVRFWLFASSNGELNWIQWEGKLNISAQLNKCAGFHSTYIFIYIFLVYFETRNFYFSKITMDWDSVWWSRKFSSVEHTCSFSCTV